MRTLKKTYGVGINDADYKLRITKETRDTSGKRISVLIWECPYFRKWKAMLGRCYSDKHQKRRPTYIGCSVCEEWLTFSNFKSWMETQDWEGKVLDKDLLIYKNKVYSPETCVFVDETINLLLGKRTAARGDYPLGVYFYHREGYCKYAGQVMYNRRKINTRYFDTPLAAHRHWQLVKSNLVRSLAETETDEKVKSGLFRVYNKIYNDYCNNIITEDY